MEREKFGSRLGFILVSAGCAIGLGNVWRFPYIVGQYGGAAFILIYLIFLVIFGLPIMTMEFAVGRASGQSIAKSFQVLEPKGSKWGWIGYIGVIGNYLLMMFYTTVAGWIFNYLIKMAKGDFDGISAAQVEEQFEAMTGDVWVQVLFLVIVCILGFLVCSFGIQKGVEKVNKVMMVALLALIVVLAVRSVTLEGAGEGLRYYLVPDFNKMMWDADGNNIFGEAVFAALGQAFFTLSLGMGSMAIFGTYIGKERSLLGESISITVLDTFVAFMAGLIIFPACSAYGVAPDTGPSLLFISLPNVFNSMLGGRIWGALFFLFMLFAAMSTVVAVFENIISAGIELFHWSRKKSCVINGIAIVVLSLPCIFGFNIWSAFQPLGAGTTVQDLEDFLITSNIQPLGALAYVLFCTVSAKKAWGWKNFLAETNVGKGLKFPAWARIFVSYIMPFVLLFIWVQGYISKFFA